MSISAILRTITVIFILGFVILIHEFGHFAACKVFGIRTPVFSIGFGPAIVQKKMNDTLFQIALLPFGGYVATNMHDMNQAPYWQKMIITLMGIFNNFLLAFFLLFILFYLNRTIEQLHSIQQIFFHSFHIFINLVSRSFYFFTRLFMPDERPKVARPISIVSLTSQSMQQGISFFLFFIATINIELAVFNVLPIPLLDGGQALYYTIEAVIGHTLSSAEMSLIHFIYLMIIIILVLYLNRRARKRSV